MTFPDKLLKQIDDYIQRNRKTIIQNVIKLIDIDSVYKPPQPNAPFGVGNAKALDTALQMCENLGFITKNHEYYCGTASINDSAATEISVLAHLDVVPAGSGWSTDPFKGVEIDGYITGRGSRDDKGPVVIGMHAINCIKELGLPIKSKLSLFLGCNEELGMQDVDYYLAHNPSPDFALTPDARFPVGYGEKGILEGEFIFAKDCSDTSCLVNIGGGEASNIVPNYAYADIKLSSERYERLYGEYENSADIKLSFADGILHIEAIGLSTHAAHPEGSVNAIWVLSNFICEQRLVSGVELRMFGFIRDAFSDNYGEYIGIDSFDEDSGKLTCIAGVITANEDDIRLNINIRYPVYDSSKGIINRINHMLCIVEPKYDSECIEFRVIKDSPPSYVPKDSPEVTAVNAIYNLLRTDIDYEEKPFIMRGGTYARKFKRAFSFGHLMPDERFDESRFPKGTGNLHQANESQSIEELNFGIKAYVLALLALDEIITSDK